jgi:hypothetical protein
VRAVKIGLLAKSRGQEMLAAIDAVPSEVTDYILKKMDEIESLASDTKGGKPVAPNFDKGKFAAALTATAGPAPASGRSVQRAAAGR